MKRNLPFSKFFKKLRQNIFTFLPGFILPLILLIIWYLGTSETTLLPSPNSVIAVFLHPFKDVLSCGSLMWNTFVSLVRVLLGLFFAILIGTPIGFYMGTNNKFDRFTAIITELARPLSPIALLPLSIILFKDANFTEILNLESLKYGRHIFNELQIGMIFILAWGGVFPIILETKHGVRSVRKLHIEAAKVLGASSFFTFRHVLLPASLPDIFTGFKLAIARCWMVIIAAEMLPGTNSGIGYLLRYSYQLSRLDIMLACILLIAIIGLIFSKGPELLSKKWLVLRVGER